jgi:AraC-like DNA-binding protein
MIAYREQVAPPGGASFLLKRRRDPRFPFAWHVHAELELTLIVRSRGRRFVGDSAEPYGDGDLVLLGSQLPHTWQSAPGPRRTHEAVVCQFRAELPGEAPEFRALRGLVARAARGLHFPAGAGEAARRLGDLERRQGAPRLVGLLELLDRLAALRRTRPLASRAYAPAAVAEGSSRIEGVCRELQSRFREPLSLAEAADLAHLSVPAFTRAFKRATGKTFVAYLNELRIGRACRDLIESERAVSDIAFAAGFQNLSNFNRRFLALKGLNPREFRRRHQG